MINNTWIATQQRMIPNRIQFIFLFSRSRFFLDSLKHRTNETIVMIQQIGYKRTIQDSTANGMKKEIRSASVALSFHLSTIKIGTMIYGIKKLKRPYFFNSFIIFPS